MPELPEVETIVRGLRRHMVGARIARVWTSGLPLRMARAMDVRTLREVSRGARIAAIERRGKYMVIELEPRAAILIHLGMSGRLRLQNAGEPRAKHTHVIWSLDRDRELRFVDPRRFGLVRAAAAGAAFDELGDLGPDPLRELDAEGLAQRLAAARAPIKAFLLDQTRIAGLGNIYVCEALHRARIHPATPALRVRKRAADLVVAIRAALEAALANRGTTLRDYVDENGEGGDNFAWLRVYGREGEACRECGTIIKRRIDSARSTFYCPGCQKR